MTVTEQIRRLIDAGVADLANLSPSSLPTLLKACQMYPALSLR